MKIFRSKPAGALAAAAALSMTATPALADGWGRYRHHHDGVDAGDVFAGLLIIGGIAAVAAAASNANKNKRETRYPEPNYPQSRYPSDEDYRNYRDYQDRSGRYADPREDDRYAGSDWRGAGSMDGAVDACVDEVERGSRRVDTVDGVSRDGEGWRVEGRIRDGRDYSCSVGSDGRIRRITVGGQAV